MKPDFALTLSFDGISLLRRDTGGWVRLGDVALDALDLRGALADLRSETDALSPRGGQVRLVIPNEQIKYLALPETGKTGDALLEDIRAALDGATPYAVDDLSFDWSVANGTIHVAAVANETLDEAEAFAKSHHFDPVCFGAIVPDGQFDGDVFFGAAASWAGTTPHREDAAMVMLPATTWDDVPTGEGADATPPPTEAGPQETGPQDNPAAAASAPHDPQAGAETEGDADSDAALAPGAADPDKDAASASSTTEPRPDPETAPPAFASIRASRGASDLSESHALPKLAAATTDAAPAPRFKLGGARKSARDSDITAPALPVDAQDDMAERKGFGFFSRRKPDTPDIPAPQVAPEPPITAPSVSARTLTPDTAPANDTPKHDPDPARAAVARIAAMRANRAATPREVQEPIADERERMTIFGARTEPQIGGKPRFLGLMLTSALLIFLLAVAAWASVFLDRGLTQFFDREDTTPSIARMPDVELMPLDGSVTASPPETEDTELASLTIDEVGAPFLDDGLSEILPPPAALTPEEADARYAATGIWQRSPTAPAPPTLTSLDDLYVASIDGSVQQFDAVALPAAEALRNDRTYLSQPNPAAPGTRFSLDDRGLVIATPEGAINPEGVRIFAGLPPVVPPSRPAPPEIAPEPPEEGAATVVTPALQAFRPRPRPGGLIEGNERSKLAGRTMAELAGLRPRPRPETLKAEEELSQPDATQFAVAQSVAPVTRPRDFSRIVDQARDTQQSAPDQPTQVAAVAPRAVQPRIPSTANVAQQATVANALNLRRINLIGVYGKPSSRRALVRLSNGRYQKVQVGDRLDGGRVAAIGESELRYSKNGRNVVLDMPDG